MPAALDENGLNEKREAFVRFYVDGHEKAHAAALAGYAFPAVEGARLMQDDRILAAVQAEVVRRVHTEGMTLAVSTLFNLLKSDKTPAGAKVDAARLLLNKGPLNDKAVENAYGGNKNDKPMSERSVEELQEFIKGGQERLRKLQEKRALDAQAIPIGDDNQLISKEGT